MNLKVNYNFEKNVVTLFFNTKHGSNSYVLKSLEVNYNFQDFKISKQALICISDMAEYKFSTKNIPRHVFYPQYTCKAGYRLGEYPGTFKIEAQFDIPYFQKSTKVLFTKLEGYEIPKVIEGLFPDEKKLINYVK